MLFHDITIRAGERVSVRRHDTENLVRAAVDIFAGMLDGHCPGDFREPVPVDGVRHITLHWTCEPAYPSTAFATFYARGQLATTSIMLEGADQSAELEPIRAFQQMILRVFRPTPIEPAFDVLSIRERPLLATIPWPNPAVAGSDIMLIADMETVLAAVFFARRREGA